MTLSDPRRSRRSLSGVEAATLAHDGSPPITRITEERARVWDAEMSDDSDAPAEVGECL